MSLMESHRSSVAYKIVRVIFVLYTCARDCAGFVEIQWVTGGRIGRKFSAQLFTFSCFCG